MAETYRIHVRPNKNSEGSADLEAFVLASSPREAAMKMFEELPGLEEFAQISISHIANGVIIK